MEKDTQKLILDWLAAKRIWNMRLNTGAFKGSYKGKSRFVRFGRPGCADILAVKAFYFHAPPMCTAGAMGQGTFTVNVIGANQASPIPAYWIEVKQPKGIQSDEQKKFQKEVEAEGMTYILARDLEDVIKVMG